MVVAAADADRADDGAVDDDRRAAAEQDEVVEVLGAVEEDRVVLDKLCQLSPVGILKPTAVRAFLREAVTAIKAAPSIQLKALSTPASSTIVTAIGRPIAAPSRSAAAIKAWASSEEIVCLLMLVRM